MLLRVAVAGMVLAGVLVALWAWRRPPRRLSRLDLPAMGLRGPAIVQFSTAYCAPCRAAIPHLRSVAEQARLPYHQVDVGSRPDVARAHGIRTVPTIAVARSDGRVVGVWTGIPRKGQIADAARRAVAEA